MNEIDEKIGVGDKVSMSGDPGATAQTEAALAADASTAAEGTGTVETGAQVTSAASVGPSQADTEIAEGIESGALSPEAAHERLLDEVLQAQMPTDTTPAEAAHIRGELAALLVEDPLLEDLLSRG